MSFNRITAPGNYVFQDKNQTGVKTNYIAGLSNKPQVTAADLKKMFDNAGGDLMTYLTALAAQINSLITAIEASTAAANIGASTVGLVNEPEGSVQVKLIALKEYVGDIVSGTNSGDMARINYATKDERKVDNAFNADKLGDVPADGYLRQIVWPNEKTTIADYDAFPLADSAAGNAQKKTLWVTIKNTLLTVFANTFAAKTHGHTTSEIPWVALAGHKHLAADVSGVALTGHGHSLSTLNGVAAASHSHGVTDLSGVAKSSGGIRIFLDSDDKSGAQTNDLWFSNT